MENPDTRGEIFSYLRKKPQLSCFKCKSVLIWDKQICNYHLRSLEKNFTAAYCNSCYFSEFVCTIS